MTLCRYFFVGLESGNYAQCCVSYALPSCVQYLNEASLEPRQLLPIASNKTTGRPSYSFHIQVCLERRSNV